VFANNKEVNMSGPIYKVFLIHRWTDAWYQLSTEERQAFLAKSSEALEQAGGKMLVACISLWSSEEWPVFGVEVFPDVEAVQRHTELLAQFSNLRYVDSISALGTEWKGELFWLTP
jgi:hypothetical protein